MTVLTLDIENTVTKYGNKRILDPYDPDNKIVLIGYKFLHKEDWTCLFVDHKERCDGPSVLPKLQKAIDDADLIVYHGAQHDLKWLLSCGIEIHKPIWCTMIGEYILQRGVKKPLDMDSVALRRYCVNRKEDTLKKYLDAGYQVDEIPLDDLVDYLEADIRTTEEIYLKQKADYLQPENEGLLPTFRRTCQTCIVLVHICHVGVKIDKQALDDVRQQYTKEKDDLEAQLNEMTREIMGDVPVNLSSPEQMSQVIYSVKMRDKSTWTDMFFNCMSDKQFKQAYNTHTTRIKKQKAYRCKTCKGTGMIRKIKKNGQPYKQMNICPDCVGEGVRYRSTDEVAGLKFMPSSHKWVTANGFSTSKENLLMLQQTAKSAGNDMAADYVGKIIRLTAISSYLSSFVDAIDTFTRSDGYLHVQLTQTVTATARLSGKEPNMQNMPRGGTFPVKKVFVSRWSGGKIMEADFAQLEFRAAGFLSGDAIIFKEVTEGVDVHSFTSTTITDHGLPTTRQEGKPHTFAPLYGATGYGQVPAVKAYYEAFIEKYAEGVGEWHKRLGNDALNRGKVVLPTGREFDFSHVRRNRNGNPSHFTQIKNYPVQSFATADVVPMVLCWMFYEMRELGLQSVIVNTVHDSIVLDIHPDEIEIVCALVKKVSDTMRQLMLDYLAVDVDMPMLLEAKIGENWLDTQDVNEYNSGPLEKLYERKIEQNERNKRSSTTGQYGLSRNGFGYGPHSADWQSRYAAPTEDQ